MKKSMLLGILFLSAMLLVSCGKSPQEKLLGEWETIGEKGTVTFNSNGTVITRKGKDKWELSDEDPLVLSIINKRGETKAQILVTFISDDEMEFIVGEEKRKVTRKQ